MYGRKLPLKMVTGTTQRDGMGREVGEGFRMADTCTPMADACHCMGKTTIIL